MPDYAGRTNDACTQVQPRNQSLTLNEDFILCIADGIELPIGSAFEAL
jgi:hypothetical protein